MFDKNKQGKTYYSAGGSLSESCLLLDACDIVGDKTLDFFVTFLGLSGLGKIGTNFGAAWTNW